MPTRPFRSTDDEITVNERRALGPTLGPPPDDDEEEDDDDEDEGAPGAPPEADTAALRALAAAALLRRLELERSGAGAEAQAALSRWVSENGLQSSFGPAAFGLFDAAPGGWSAEDLEGVAWAAEELQMICWALGRAEPPALFARAEAAALLEGLPAAGNAEPFSLTAKLRPLDTLEATRALYEAMEVAAQTEAWARAIIAEPERADADDELEALLDGLAHEGFPRAQLAKDLGKGPAAVQGLRLVGRQLVEQMFAEGSPHRAVAFAPERLPALDDEALAVFLATSQLRAAALAWLTEGDEWDFGDADP